MARIKPRLLKGFRDYLPRTMVPRVKLLRRVTEVFERFGFEPLDTPSLEYAEILLGKAGPEAEKLFYRFQDHGERDVALRYELTVSLARVIAQYSTDLPKPFKRYQLGPVWRAESPAKGRFREFWQCDVDIVGTPSLLADAECIAIADAVMAAVGVKGFRIRFNNRKLFRALQEKAGIADDATMAAAMRIVDKLDKIGITGVETELQELEEGKDGSLAASARMTLLDYLKLAQFDGDNAARLMAARAFLAGSEIGDVACDEIAEILRYTDELGIPQDVLQFDVSIVRGLDYYTGTVFETFLDDAPEFGSVMSGGRYDGLIGVFANEEIPAVGISVGIDRLIAALEHLGLLPAATSAAVVLVTVLNADARPWSLKAACNLRRAGVNTEVYLGLNAKLSKQMKYASRKGIPMVVIAGEEEIAEGVVSLRDVKTGSQQRVPIGLLAQVVQDNYVDPDADAAGRSWDWEFSKQMIARVPEVGGVFLLRGDGHEVLACGWASFPDLRAAISKAVTDEQQTQVKTFDWYEIRDDKLSEALCAFLIERLTPAFHQS